MSQQVRFTANAIGPARKESFMGREFRVFPATLVRSQVLNNNLGSSFLPAEEITENWAAAWNGVPVVLDHPRERGVPRTARDPEVINARGAGFVFRAKAENGELKADVFLDPDRAEHVAGLKAVIQKLEKGQPVELSTGFPTAAENTSGTHEGKAYNIIMRPQGADHLAIFADKKGACSVEDGCGLGIHEDGENCSCGEGMNENEVANSLWQRLKGFIMATNKGEDAMEDREKVINEVAEQTGLKAEHLEEMEDKSLQALHAKVTAEAEPGEAENADDGDGTTDADSEAVNDLLAEMQAKIDALEEAAKPALQEREEEKAGLVTELADNERCAFEENELEAMNVDQLRKLRATARGESYAGKGGPRTVQNTSEPDFLPVKPYWETADNEEG